MSHFQVKDARKKARSENEVSKFRSQGHKFAACEGKKSFDSYAGADRALRGLHKRGNSHPYKCGFCRQWHIGRERKKQK